MRHHHRPLLLALGAAVLAGGGSLRAQDFVVEPQMGAIELAQYDFFFANSATPNSTSGLLTIDIPALRFHAPFPEGFLNVETSLGWVVQNLPIYPTYPYDTLSISFEITTAHGIDVSSLDAHVVFSLDPKLAFGGGGMLPFPVFPELYTCEGRDPFYFGPPPAATVPGGLGFVPGGILDSWFQPGHPNVQTAHNQCGPAAVANSMQWLADTYDIPMPFPNDPGLGIFLPDGTLVGELDWWMGRGGVSRQNGNTVGDVAFLNGKLDFIDFYGLPLAVKHQSIAGAGYIGGGNHTHGTSTSTGHGKPTAEWILQELQDGEDVELGYAGPGVAGHWVELTGGGHVLGIPFITFVSDHVQSNQDARDGVDNNEGCDKVDSAFLVDTDNDGCLNMIGVPGSPEVEVVVSESPAGLGPWLWTSNMVSGLVGQITLDGGVPDEPVGFAYSTAGTGPTSVTAGSCGSLLVELSDPIGILPLVPAGPNGTAMLQLPIPPGLSGLDLHLQSLVLPTCELSNPVTVTLE